MAVSFDSVGVLKCVPRIETSDFRWILWPTYAWRVLVPTTREHPLNIFERAVLKILRTGELDVSRISEMLELSPELVGLILLELEEKHCIKVGGAITQRGIDLLEDLVSESHEELQVVHVFTDGITGEVWPLILNSDLSFVDVTRDDEGYISFLSGTTGAPTRERVFEVRQALAASSPSPEAILKASRRQRKRVKGGLDPEYQIGAVAKIDFLEAEGVPVHFATRVFQNSRGELSVQEPFSSDESPTLLRSLLREMHEEHGAGLRAYLRRYIEHDPENPTLTGLGQEAEHWVRERFTLAVMRDSELFDYLVAMKRTHLEMGLPDAPKDKADDFLVKAQKVLEHVMSQWNTDYKFDERSWNRFSKGEKRNSINSAFLESKAEEAGFDVPLPSSLIGVRWGKVNHVLRSGGTLLRPALIVNIIAAAENPEHPLKGAKDTRLLHRIDALAGARDSSAHVSRKPTNQDTPERYLNTVTDVIDLFLE